MCAAIRRLKGNLRAIVADLCVGTQKHNSRPPPIRENSIGGKPYCPLLEAKLKIKPGDH